MINKTLFKLKDINKSSKRDVWDRKVSVEESYYYWRGAPIIFKRGNLPTTKPLVVELFCGCGGTSKGFEMAGYQIAVGVDIHKPSIATFNKNHTGASSILGDIKKVKPAMLKKLLNGRKIDVLIAGVPCQGFSLNNRKRHSNDKRNYLFKEFIEYISALKPKVAILENVSGMLSTSDGSFVKDIEKSIADAGNMKVSSKLLLAADYGVPQMRRRLVFVGVHGEKSFDFDNDLIKTNGPETSKNYITVRDALSDLPKLNAAEEKNYYATKPTSDFQILMRKKTGAVITNHKAPDHPAEVVEKIKKTTPGKSMYPRFKQRIRLSWDELSPTQVSGGIRPQFQFGHPEDARGLSIRERCRIQSFPDDFIIEGGIVQGRVQTGNAVPPLLAKAIAEAVKKYIK